MHTVVHMIKINFDEKEQSFMRYGPLLSIELEFMGFLRASTNDLALN